MKALTLASICLCVAVPSATGATLSVEGLPSRAWGGEALTVQVTIRDAELMSARQVTCAFSYEDWAVGGRTFQLEGSGVETKVLPENGRATFAVQLPEVPVRIRAMFSIRAVGAEEGERQLSRKVEIFPRVAFQDFAEAYSSVKIGAVYISPDGAVRSRLEEADCVELASAAAVRVFRGDCIFAVGPSRGGHSGIRAALRERAREGLRVVWLEKPSAASLGKQAPAEARILAPDSGVFEGLSQADLRDWRSVRNAIVSTVGWPSGGNGIVLADVPGTAEPAAVCIEGRCGRGRILWCGFAIGEALSGEPVAERLLLNLLRWGSGQASPQLAPHVRVAALSGAAFTLERVGVLGSTGPMGKGDLLIDGGDSLAGAVVRDLQVLLREGGAAILLGAGPEEMDKLSEMLKHRWLSDVHSVPPSLRARRAHSVVVPALVHHRLLDGVRPEDVQSLVNGVIEREHWAVSIEADQEHFVDLVGGGLLTKFERDGICLLLWQLPLGKGGGSAAERVLSALLTNAGAELHPVGTY